MADETAEMVFHKNVTEDVDEGFKVLRDVNTTSGLDLVKPLIPGNVPVGSIARNGRRIAELRVFSNVDSGTVTWAVKAWPRGANKRTAAPYGFANNGAGILVYSGIWTTHGPSFPLIHPVTGAVDTATFFEASNDGTNTYAAGEQIKMFPALGTDATSGFQKRMIVDMQGYAFLWAEVTALGASATRGIVGCKWLE